MAADGRPVRGEQADRGGGGGGVERRFESGDEPEDQPGGRAEDQPEREHVDEGALDHRRIRQRETVVQSPFEHRRAGGPHTHHAAAQQDEAEPGGEGAARSAGDAVMAARQPEAYPGGLDDAAAEREHHRVHGAEGQARGRSDQEAVQQSLAGARREDGGRGGEQAHQPVGQGDAEGAGQHRRQHAGRTPQ
ncbi:hypothetical protein [Streptacidiphilus sp. EB129]|uniref:hypothetical protein n=1 Tax=Streptacidiphilus sp. EB129 TaxID=3156262 RepID=UPI003518DF03